MNRIAFAGDPHLCDDLAAFADVKPLYPHSLSNADDVAADLLLIAGDWPRAGDPWREALLNLSAEAVARLRDLIAALKARGIPSALWITGEAETASAYAHLIGAVDAVFAPENSGIDGARRLDAGINVKLFNPVRPDIDSCNEDAPSFRFLIDGAFELSQPESNDAATRLLRPFLGYNSWAMDSSYRYFQSANIKLPSTLRSRFLGCPTDAAQAWLVKIAHALFLPATLRSKRPARFGQLARRSAVCKTPVLVDQVSTIDDWFIGFSGADRGEEILGRLSTDMIAREAIGHLAWRNAVSHHTLFERIEAIFSDLGITPRYNATAHPSVNIVAPTVRPQQIPYILAMYCNQLYDNIGLTIVVNGNGIPEELARLIRDTVNARLCFVPSDKTLGYCMNFGIDQAPADYWAKWDDDDVYGPHFLGDQLLQRKYVDFDIAGKAAIFNYIEEHDSVYLRSVDARDGFVSQVGGGTLLVKNPNRYFAEDGRGGEDRAFLHLAKERGDRIYAGDPFNFLQVRRAEHTSHTWALGAHAIDLSGPKRAGLDLDHVVL
ncbi:MAG: hypothetical protein ABSD74_03585 [Rhizomicrobium sp.]